MPLKFSLSNSFPKNTLRFFKREYIIEDKEKSSGGKQKRSKGDFYEKQKNYRYSDWAT
jgi:hypothetical protein